MEEKQENELQRIEPKETPETSDEEKSSGGSVFEGIYDKLPDISVRSVDRFIILCVIAFIAVILIGVLKANHIF